TAPYFYYPYPVQGGQTFAATLGAPITTAPAAETVETITITDAATASVFYGLRLMLPSGEVLRVLDVNGDQVTVVRGASLAAGGPSTPAPQAAGPILVGWRVPHTSTTQYDSIGRSAVEIIMDSPHKVLAGFTAALGT